jgi:hypothetical protein
MNKTAIALCTCVCMLQLANTVLARDGWTVTESYCFAAGDQGHFSGSPDA